MFSPSPVSHSYPRRGIRHATPATAGGSPPSALTRRFGSSRPGSRLATPTRAGERLPFIRDTSLASRISVDDEGNVSNEKIAKPETVFAKSEEISVLFYAHLPVEVKQALRNADFYQDLYSGDVDTTTGFAVVSSAQTCFVWQYSQALSATPTCYIFSCPIDATRRSTPFHALVPTGVSREPGLILLSAPGEIKFWDSVSVGLSGAEHFISSTLGLDSWETVTSLTRSEPQVYIASTTIGRLFRITLSSSAGKYHLTSRVFSQPQSSLSLSRLLPSLWSSYSPLPLGGNINAVALGKISAIGRDVWVVIDLRIQKWSLTADGWEEPVLDEDLANIVRSAVKGAFSSAPSENSALDLEMLDLAIVGPEKLVILVSYASTEEDNAMDIGTHPHRIYALVWLSHAAEIFTAGAVVSVPYKSSFSSGAPIHPRIRLVSNGALVCILFGEAIALCATDSDYKDRLELKSTTDRTLGCGVVRDGSEILLLSAGTMMKVTLDMERVANFNANTGGANLIKSIMTQAILYGSNPENPLHFSFPPEVDEDSLMSGSQQLSRAVLQSDSEIIRPNHDLSSQMTARKERLSFLIKFINDNAALAKISQRSRQQLATDAETLYASHQLWLLYNEFIASGHPQCVLDEAVIMYMTEAGEGHHEDLMRAFFRLHVGDLGKLLEHILHITRKSSYQIQRKMSDVLTQASRCILTILNAAREYREYNIGVYGIELPSIDPWTSQQAVIDIMTELYEVTAKLVETVSTSNQTSDNTRTLQDQMPELAATLFACVRERLAWLGSAMAADESGTERQQKELDDKFRHLRPHILETLRKNGHAASAFRLAEDYRDFRSLASLCHTGTVYPPQQNPNAGRIQSYIEMFKDDFTSELYQWYIEHGELRTMLAQDEVYSDHVDRFFEYKPNPTISWIHDLGKRRYGAASEALLLDANNTTDLASKHLMLSIGKLSQLAQLQEESSVDESVLDAFHDGLDFISVHDRLANELKLSLVKGRGKQSLDMQVETIAKAKASRLIGKRAFLGVFKQLVRHLMQGKALSVEEAVELLTLKDNELDVEDYATALHLLAHAKDLPEARRVSGFTTVWRRAFIHDDWVSIRHTASVSDAQLNKKFRSTALYVALEATLPKLYQPEGYVLQPAQALTVPSTTDISIRWPGMPPEDIEALERDYLTESRELVDLALEDVYERVKELAQQDTGWEVGS